jgi:hypothetical protein
VLYASSNDGIPPQRLSLHINSSFSPRPHGQKPSYYTDNISATESSSTFRFPDIQHLLRSQSSPCFANRHKYTFASELLATSVLYSNSKLHSLDNGRKIPPKAQQGTKRPLVVTEPRVLEEKRKRVIANDYDLVHSIRRCKGSQPCCGHVARSTRC